MSDLGRWVLATSGQLAVPLLGLSILVGIVAMLIGPRLLWAPLASASRGIALAVLACSEVASNLTQLSYNGQAGTPAYAVNRDWFLFGGALLALVLLAAWCLLPPVLGDVALVGVGLVTGMASTLAYAGVSDALLTWLGTTVALLVMVAVVRLVARHLGPRWLGGLAGLGLLVFVLWTAFQLL